MRLPLRVNFKKIKFERGLNLYLQIKKDITLRIFVSNDGAKSIFTLGYKNVEFKEVYKATFKIAKENGLINFDSETNKITNLEELKESDEAEIFNSVIKQIESFKGECKKILYDLSDLSVFSEDERKYVWLNVMDGFSDSWEGQEETEQMLVELDDDEIKESKNWKLIEYICHTDKNFEFNKNMKLK